MAVALFIASFTVTFWLPSLNVYLEVPKADRLGEVAWMAACAQCACALFLLAWVIQEAEERAMKSAQKE